MGVIAWLAGLLYALGVVGGFLFFVLAFWLLLSRRGRAFCQTLLHCLEKEDRPQ